MKKKTKTATKAEPKKTTKKVKKTDAPKPVETPAAVKRPRGRPRKSPKLVTEEKPLSKPSDFVMAFPEDDEFHRQLAETFEKAAEAAKLGTPEQRLAQRIKANIQDLAFERQRALTGEEALTLASFVIENYDQEVEQVNPDKVLAEIEKLQSGKTDLDEKPEFKFRVPQTREDTPSLEEIRAKVKKIVAENRGRPIEELLELTTKAVRLEPVAIVDAVIEKIEELTQPTAVGAIEPSPEAEEDLQAILGLTVPFTLPWYKRWWLAVLRFFN